VGTIIGNPALIAWSDDDHSGSNSVPEATYAQQAIERAAAMEINYFLWERYDLAGMRSAGNQWLRWANAILAAFEMMTRRGVVATKTLQMRVMDIRKMMRECRDTRGQIPDAIEAMDWLPAVSNFEVERWRAINPVRVVPQECTRAAPGEGVERNPANSFGGHMI
jgi:hypothetical protein